MTAAGSGLPAPLREGCSRAPAEVYDVALADLDGVIYRGAKAVRGAAEAVREAQSRGMRFAFVTNNALRTPETVSAHLTDLGVPATPQDVVTSAQAAARLLQEKLLPGEAVLVCGGAGLRTAVQEAGLRVVTAADDRPSAVVCGYDPTLDYGRLAEATLAVRAGAFFVASNLDATVPTERGLLPGNGALVSVISTATGRRPIEAGKPERALHQESIRRSRARRPLIVGDRLDTDIEAGVRWGTASLLVLTGVTDAVGLLGADERHRPSLLAAGLSGLLRPHPPVTSEGDAWVCGRWRARAESGALRVTAVDTDRHRQGWGVRRDGSTEGRTEDRAFVAPVTDDLLTDDVLTDDLLTDDGVDALRAAAVAGWQASDSGAAISEIVEAPPGSGLVNGPLKR